MLAIYNQIEQLERMEQYWNDFIRDNFEENPEGTSLAEDCLSAIQKCRNKLSENEKYFG